MNTVKQAIYQPNILLTKDIFTHNGATYHAVNRVAGVNDLILVTKTFGKYKKGEVMTVSDKTRQDAWCKDREDGFPIAVRHGDYAVLVPMKEATPLPTTVYSKSHLSTLEASGTPIFNGYDHTVLDFSAVEDGHTLVLKLPAGDYVTICGMIMRDRDNTILDIQYHGDNGQEMIGFTGNQVSPNVQDTRMKHNLYSLDIRPDHKKKPYGDNKTLAFRRLDEVIMDISIQVGAWIALNPDRMPDGYDSRRLISEIHRWAVEYESTYGTRAQDDKYYDKVDNFANKKIIEWAKKYKD